MTASFGRLAVVGIGPGGPDQCSPEVTDRLAAATDLVGYAPYLAMVVAAVAQTLHPSDNREEAARARAALDLAAGGADVVVVSSGDPGVFAMATAVIEAVHEDALAGRRSPPVDVLPGITAASAAAALVGAPLGHDFCVISLSDVLKPFEVVERRLAAVAAADLVIALYNPISSQRPWQLGRALEVVAAHRTADTPVVVAREVGRAEQAARVTTLGALVPEDVDMRTVLIVGSSTTRAFVDSNGRTWAYTPRRYPA